MSDLQKRRSGILLHPTSLPGPHGSGDFGPAAYHFVDWLHSAGQRLWQVLPLSPIGPGNSPYASVSAFAGNPLLIALEPLMDKGWLAQVPEEELNRLWVSRVDYGSVVPWRMDKLRAAWAGFKTSASGADRAALRGYAETEQEWLADYALFMALDQALNPVGGPWRAWCEWDSGLAWREPTALAAARTEHADEIAFWQFTQWCFDTQWQALRAYARSKDVAIVGDIPIFIAHHGADCWARPELYWLDDDGQPSVVAGVPPDYFAATGQRWGNPLYRWEAMAQDGFAWWVARVRRQLALCDLVRIDHFRGFEACWEIPATCPTAVDGQWVNAPGQAFFHALNQALGQAPIIAEDLGVITPEVEALRDGLGFPGMRILQFAFDGHAKNPYLPHNYVANVVAYTGTHDNDTSRGWWEALDDAQRAYVCQYLGLRNDDSPHWAMVRAVQASVANTVIVPLQDVLGLDSQHRMNTPGLTGAWEWRFSWDWVDAQPAERLREWARLYGRAATD